MQSDSTTEECFVELPYLFEVGDAMMVMVDQAGTCVPATELWKQHDGDKLASALFNRLLRDLTTNARAIAA